MNIQIFGKPKCFDTKKAERYFKERKIKFQLVDITRYPMSKGEFQSVKNAICKGKGIEAIIDEKSKSELIDLIKYLANESDKEEKVFENQVLVKTPIVRNGKLATTGHCPDVWKNWE